VTWIKIRKLKKKTSSTIPLEKAAAISIYSVPWYGHNRWI